MQLGILHEVYSAPSTVMPWLNVSFNFMFIRLNASGWFLLTFPKFSETTVCFGKYQNQLLFDTCIGFAKNGLQDESMACIMGPIMLLIVVCGLC